MNHHNQPTEQEHFDVAAEAKRFIEQLRQVGSGPSAKPQRRLFLCVKCRREAPDDYHHDGGTYYCFEHTGDLAQQIGENVAEMLESIPEKFHWAKLRSTEMSERVAEINIIEARAAFERYLRGTVPWITLSGLSGVGKTSLAAAFIRTASIMAGRRQGHRGLIQARFFSANDIVAANRTHRLGSPDPHLIHLAKTVDWAVIDDVGNESPRSDLIKEILFARHDHNRHTLLTTALEQVQIEKRYGGGVARRMCENGALVLLKKVPTTEPVPVRKAPIPPLPGTEEGVA
jgi:hypothetical protein